VEGLETGKAEVAYEEVIVSEFFPQAGGGVFAVYPRRQGAPAHHINPNVKEVPEARNNTGGGRGQAGPVFKAEADEYTEASFMGNGVKGGPPSFRQPEEFGPYPVGFMAAVKPGEQVKEEIKGRTEGASLVKAQDGGELCPAAIFFPGTGKPVQDD
jgi:hypothetical protein